MRLLLDTHTLLWWVENAPQLSLDARQAMVDDQAVCCVSAASAWEMAITAGPGKLRLSVGVRKWGINVWWVALAECDMLINVTHPHDP